MKFAFHLAALALASAALSACSGVPAQPPTQESAPEYEQESAPVAASESTATVPAEPGPTAASPAASDAADVAPPYQGPEAVLCGCGCCGGVTPKDECAPTQAEFDQRVAADRNTKKADFCSRAGCSPGVRLRLCSAQR